MEEVLYGASLGQKLGVGEDLVAYSRLDVMPVYIKKKTSKSRFRIPTAKFHIQKFKNSKNSKIVKKVR
jgi:hypothetical protein